jgi:hypothetical protein
MAGFSYGEWRFIWLAPVAIFCGVMGLAEGEGPVGLICIAIGIGILFLAYNKHKNK